MGFAAGALSGQGYIPKNIQQANDKAKEIKEAKREMQDALKDLKEEMKAPTTKDVLGQQAAPATTKANPKEAEALLAQFAGIIEEEQTVDKKRKKQKLDEKLKEMKLLAQKLEDVDLDQLTDDEKQEIEEFKQNMNTLRNLQGQIRHLDDKEIQYQQVLEHQKRSRR